MSRLDLDGRLVTSPRNPPALVRGARSPRAQALRHSAPTRARPLALPDTLCSSSPPAGDLLPPSRGCTLLPARSPGQGEGLLIPRRCVTFPTRSYNTIVFLLPPDSSVQALSSLSPPTSHPLRLQSLSDAGPSCDQGPPCVSDGSGLGEEWILLLPTANGVLPGLSCETTVTESQGRSLRKTARDWRGGAGAGAASSLRVCRPQTPGGPTQTACLHSREISRGKNTLIFKMETGNIYLLTLGGGRTLRKEEEESERAAEMLGRPVVTVWADLWETGHCSGRSLTSSLPRPLQPCPLGPAVADGTRADAMPAGASVGPGRVLVF